MSLCILQASVVGQLSKSGLSWSESKSAQWSEWILEQRLHRHGWGAGESPSEITKNVWKLCILIEQIETQSS